MGAIIDKLKGRAKRVEGQVTGDRVREAQGVVEETKGKVEGAFDRAGQKIRARVDQARAKHAMKKANRSVKRSVKRNAPR